MSFLFLLSFCADGNLLFSWGRLYCFETHGTGFTWYLIQSNNFGFEEKELYITQNLALLIFQTFFKAKFTLYEPTHIFLQSLKRGSLESFFVQINLTEVYNTFQTFFQQNMFRRNFSCRNWSRMRLWGLQGSPSFGSSTQTCFRYHFERIWKKLYEKFEVAQG